MFEDPILDAPLDSISDQDVVMSSEIKGYLHETGKWGKFLAVVGFVFTGLVCLGAVTFGLFAGVLGSMVPMATEAYVGLVGLGIAFLYLGVALLYFFPSWYLYRFSTNMMAAVRNDNVENFTTGFKNLKSLYRFFGIMMLVIFCLYPVLLICLFIFGKFA
jgi:hypothetical protein